MEHNFHDLPMPRPYMMLVVGVGIAARYLGEINHDEWTKYLSNGACLGAIIHYLWVFYKWVTSKKPRP